MYMCIWRTLAKLSQITEGGGGKRAGSYLAKMFNNYDVGSLITFNVYY